MNKQRLRGLIVEKHGTLSAFARDVMGLSASSLTLKLRTGSFTMRQIATIISALDLTPEAAYDIFFADDVVKNSNKETA